MPQGTIKSYDEKSKSGLLLDDTKTEFAFDHDSFRNTGMRLFRIGQRVSYQLHEEGTRKKVRELRILTVH